MTNDTVRVPLGDRSYDIHIGAGLLERAGAYLAPHLSRPRTIIVTDENVAAAQGPRLESGLRNADIKFDTIVLPPGEGTKSLGFLDQLAGKLLDFGVERNDLIIAFGGGVIGDLTGFAAAILRRGCRFAQIPTSLLAQVDSAVGGKTAINVAQGKNLLGAFHQPSIVLADIAALETLPERELRAGYAEIVKYGLINDKEFIGWLAANGAKLLSGDGGSQRQYAVRKSCAAKAAIVASDERETGVRALLNLGHTFGHAFEAFYGYSDKLLHGEAVALGMCLAYDYSVRLGHCSPADASAVSTLIRDAGLPVAIGDINPNPEMNSDAIADLMMQDKKVQDGKLTMILAKGVGEAFIAADQSIADIKAFLKEKIAS